MKTLQVLTFALVALGSCQASCPPKPPTLEEFDVVAYLGNWYQQAIIPVVFQPSGSYCTRAQYSDLGDGIVGVHNSETNPEGVFYEICGSAYQADPVNAPGELVVGFPEAIGNTANYLILDTDYTSYTVIYNCQDVIGGGKREYGWVMTREQRPDQDLVDAALSVFTANGIDISQFEMTAQPEDCDYDVIQPSCTEEWA